MIPQYFLQPGRKHSLRISRTLLGLLILFGTTAALTNVSADEFDGESKTAATVSTPETSKSVSSVPLASIRKISHQIDYLVETRLEELDENFNPLASDEIFLRRIYLDIAGRIPTLKETQEFLNSKRKNKRAELIDELLDSYGYVSRQFNFFADLLRLQTRGRNSIGQLYIDFVKDSLEQNKPFDQFVHELLSAEGAQLEQDNGAVGYYLRDLNMPEDNMSNTIRVFLGTRLECAQCHDHPFDKWTQKQYFEMVAFTGGLNYRVRNDWTLKSAALQKLARDESVTEEVRQILRRIVQPATYGIGGSGTGLARLPEGYLGDEGDEYDIVTAKTMFGDDIAATIEVPTTVPTGRNARRRASRQPQQIQGAKEIGSRQAYADWLTSHDNPRFAKVIANRLWKQAMGLGLIEPVDIIEDKTVASNPELMEFLTESMIDLDFDIKQFLRAIYNSRTYQSEAHAEDVVSIIDYGFNGPLVRRMSGEQIWDSMVTLTVTDVDERIVQSDYRQVNVFGGETIQNSFENLKQMSPEEVLEIAELIAQKGGRRAIQMMNSEAAQEAAEEKQFIRNRVRQIAREFRAAEKNNRRDLMEKLAIERNQLLSELRKSQGNNSLIRASELPSPAPAGHFLRQFGQSDREQIQNANTDPSVTQVLALMNGYVEQRLANNNETVLMRDVFLAEPANQKINTIFMTILNRKPTRQEKQIWTRDFRDYGHDAIGDLIWTLVNTNEFMFVK